MSFFSARENQDPAKKYVKPTIHFSDFLKINPWVIVKGGSYMGFFDYMPLEYRVGKWHPMAFFALLGSIAALLLTKPTNAEFGIVLHSSDAIHFIRKFSLAWYYNMSAFLFMSIMQAHCYMKIGLFPIVTFTIQSWTLLTIRHGLIAALPFFGNTYWVNFFTELLRGPVLLSSFLVSLVWNFMLLPLIYFKFTPDQKKSKFLKWSFSFRLVQWHLMNVPYAVLNSMSLPRKLTYVDLWFMYAYTLYYAIFYLLVLDRVGVHLYAVFNPRTFYSIFAYFAGIFICYGAYVTCNKLIFP